MILGGASPTHGDKEGGEEKADEGAEGGEEKADEGAADVEGASSRSPRLGDGRRPKGISLDAVVLKDANAAAAAGPQLPDDLAQLFNEYDTDKNGFLSAAELANMLRDFFGIDDDVSGVEYGVVWCWVVL